MQTIGRTSVGTAREDDNRIDQAGGTVRYGVTRVERVTAPTGAVILF